jgi:CelD/BcsL family acetyltransferase involved in cellulose biosynthesis
VEAEITASQEGLAEFIRLNRLTRREHGLPPQPRRFFENLHREVISRDAGFIALARYQEQAVAGAVFFCFGRKAVYKYGASDRRFQNLRPSNLLLWEAIRRCREKGMESLCLGRTDLHHHGLKQFKDGWGAAETRIRYLRYDFRREAFQGLSGRPSGWRENVLRRMPLPLLDAIGTLFYKHMG